MLPTRPAATNPVETEKKNANHSDMSYPNPCRTLRVPRFLGSCPQAAYQPHRIAERLKKFFIFQ